MPDESAAIMELEYREQNFCDPVPFTWGEFKQVIESHGVTDECVMAMVDYWNWLEAEENAKHKMQVKVMETDGQWFLFVAVKER